MSRAAYQREWSKTPAGRLAEERKRVSRHYRRMKLMRQYGMTVADYERMRREQGWRCGICHKKTLKTLAVDHDHITGAVRGLLCLPCNRALGLLKDDLSIVESAANYLRERAG